MKKLLALVPIFLVLLFPAFTETSSAQSKNTSTSYIASGSEFNSPSIYARRGSSSSFGSSSSSTSRQTTSNTSSSSSTAKNTDTKSSFGGFGGIMTGLIGGALLGSMLSGMGLGGLAEFAGIIMWAILGFLAFGLIRSFLNKRKEEEERQKNQGF